MRRADRCFPLSIMEINMNIASEQGQKLNAGRVRSMDGITSALFELLEVMPFAQISVTELCEKAGVARKTFYRNFPSKTSVVERLVDQVFYDFRQKYDFQTSGARKIYLYWFEYILCTPEFSTVFRDQDLYKLITAKIREFVEIEVQESMHNAASYDPLLEEYYLEFAAAGISAIMRQWINDGCRTPAKTMATLTARLIGGIVM